MSINGWWKGKKGGGRCSPAWMDLKKKTELHMSLLKSTVQMWAWLFSLWVLMVWSQRSIYWTHLGTVIRHISAFITDLQNGRDALIYVPYTLNMVVPPVVLKASHIRDLVRGVHLVLFPIPTIFRLYLNQNAVTVFVQSCSCAELSFFKINRFDFFFNLLNMQVISIYLYIKPTGRRIL